MFSTYCDRPLWHILTFLTVLSAGLLWPAGPPAFSQDAWWSLEGDFQNDSDEVQLFFELIAPISSTTDTFWLQTFSHSGGTNAAQDPIAAGGFDPIVTLYDVTGGGEVFCGLNDDSNNGGGIRDSWLSWPGVAPDPFPTDGYINTDPLTIGNYRADLTAYDSGFPGGRSPWALDLYGPWYPVTLTGLATTGDASIRSLKFGGDLSGGAYFNLASSTSATVTDEFVVGAGGEGQLALIAATTLNTPGTTSVGYNGEGLAIVSGLDAQWQAGPITVGGQLSGSGSVLVTDQGDINSGDVQIGTDSANGIVLIDGTASTGGLINPARWDASGSITVGSTGSGAGTVTIENNGALTATHDVGVSGTSSAAARVTIQEGGALRVDGTITVGPFGTVSLLQGTQSEAVIETHSFIVDPDGTFDHQDGILILDGGTFDPGSQNPGLSNSVVINGADATDFPTIRFINGASVLLPLGSAQSASVGSSNRGRLEILSGSDFNVTSGFLNIGTRWVGSVNPIAYGEVLVDGDGSTLTTLSGLTIGGGLAGGHGILRISNGGAFSVVETSATDIIGANAGTSGSLEVSGTNSLGTVPSSYTTGRTLQVGYSGLGSLLIFGGGKVSNTDAFIASYAGSDNSMVTVDGTGPAGPSTWNVNGSLYVGGDNGTFGSGGIGTLTVSNGGVVDVTDTLKVWSTGTVELLGSEINAGSFLNDEGGTFTHQDGTLTVDGGTFTPRAAGGYTINAADTAGLPTVMLVGASYTSTGTLVVGKNYGGVMEIRGGSTVNTFNGRVGLDAGDGHGHVIVEDANSRWINTGDLEIGVRSFGAMTISNGGRVENTDGAIAAVAGSEGLVVVEDGGVWQTANGLAVGGHYGAGGVGNLQVHEGGQVNAVETLWAYADGTVSMLGGEVNVGYNSLRLYDGSLVGFGDVVLSGGGYVENNGAVLPFPEPEPLTIRGGDYYQDPTGELVIRLGGTAPAEFAQLAVVGDNAILNGLLLVELVDLGGGLFIPQAGDSFEILTADGGLGGTTFDTVPADLPALTGALFWDIVYGSTFVRLDVLTPYSADFDRDGDVDNDDLTQWKGDYGINGDSDANGDGDSDGGDYLIWQRQFGSGVSVVAAGASVPEPTSVLLIVLAAVLIMAPRERRHGNY